MTKFRVLVLSPLVSAFLVSAALLASADGRADWSGRLEILGAGGGQGKPQEGKIYAKGRKLRFEINAQGRDMIVLADSKLNTAAMLMPAQKMVMEMPPNMNDNKALTCSTEDIEGCLKAKGYKKTGKDTVDGHPCAVYEGDGEHTGVKAHQKLWRPTDMKDVFMIKSSMTTDTGEVTTYVKDIKHSALDAALFKVPADYKKMQMPDFGAMHR